MGTKEEPRYALGGQVRGPLYERYMIMSVRTSLCCRCMVAYPMNDFEGLVNLPIYLQTVPYHGEAKIPQKVLQKRSEKKKKEWKRDVGPKVSKDTTIAHR